MTRRGMDPTPFLIIPLIILGLIYVPPLLFPPSQVPQAELAMKLADQVKTLPTVNNQVCRGVPDVVSNTLTIMQDMDGTLGTGFGRIAQLDPSNCDVVIWYLPILGSYNKLIQDSKKLDPKNSTSVQTFYIDAFILSSDFVLLNDKLAYKAAFEATGEINDALRLGKLRSVCGDECYRLALSGIHWSVREKMSQYLCEFENWAGHSILSNRFC